MITKQSLKLELDFYESINSRYNQILNTLPEGVLYFKYQHGKKRPYICSDGKELYLSKRKGRLINELFQRKCISESLKHVGKNIEILKLMYSQYTNYDDMLPENIGRTLLDDNKEMVQNTNVRKWLAIPNRQSTYRADEKRHRTPNGVEMRSKSEVLIGSFLEFKNIPYKYEERIFLDGNAFYPDFTVKRASDGKLIIWEHFGMMDDPGYAERNRHKRFLYEKNGYFPYDNFIATYSDSKGSIDMVLLERIVNIMLT